jgi:hypothetical protein
MKELPIIEREFLQNLRNSARGMSSSNLNPEWVRAYDALGDAADRLDAMQARESVCDFHHGIDPPPVT